MKPNEIKMALECCTSLEESECVLCPYHKDNDGGCVLDMSKDTLAYINQLEAEVERLNKEIDRLLNTRVTTHSVEKNNATAKTITYKEFVEKCCEGRVSNDPVVIAVKAKLKEMVGDD